MQSRTSGGRTTCVCDMNSAVPILDLICGILSKFCVYIVIIIFFSPRCSFRSSNSLRTFPYNFSFSFFPFFSFQNIFFSKTISYYLLRVLLYWIWYLISIFSYMVLGNIFWFNHDSFSASFSLSISNNVHRTSKKIFFITPIL